MLCSFSQKVPNGTPGLNLTRTLPSRTHTHWQQDFSTLMHMVFDTHGLEGMHSRWLIGLGCVALCVGARTVPCLHVELLTLRRSGVPWPFTPIHSTPHTHTHSQVLGLSDCAHATRLLLPPSQVRARRDEAPSWTDARPSSSALRLSKPLTHSPLPLPIPSSQTQITRNHAGSQQFSPGSPLCGGPCHGRSALWQPL